MLAPASVAIAEPADSLAGRQIDDDRRDLGTCLANEVRGRLEPYAVAIDEAEPGPAPCNLDGVARPIPATRPGYWNLMVR